MPSLMEQYSAPEDIEAYHTQMRFYRDYLPPVPVPLREHGPELDDRWCLKHYCRDGWGPFLNRGGHCFDCEEEDYQNWVEEVRCKFQRGLEAAARGEKISW